MQQLAPLSVHKKYVRVTSFTIDATPFKYNAIFTYRTGNNSLKSIFINTRETLNGTRSLTKQNTQIPSHFIREEIIETMPTTTNQNFSPIHPTLTTPHNKKTPFPQTTVQSTVKPFVAPKYSRMHYQTNRPKTKKRQPINKKIQIEKVFQIITTIFPI